MVEHVAQDFLDDVVALAPKNEIDGYPKMLGLYGIPSGSGATVVGVMPPGWAFSQRLREADVDRTILWVKPVVRRGETVSEGAAVLSKYNPWTMESLPWVPDRREASMVSQRVHTWEVDAVRRDRARDRAGVVSELVEMGVKVRPDGEVALGRRVTRDVMFEVARIEFGYDRQGIAHWRPAVWGVPRSVARRSRALFEWLVSDDLGYSSGVAVGAGRASSVKSVQKFQRMIG